MREGDAERLLETIRMAEHDAAAARRRHLETKYLAIADFRDEHGLSLAQVAEVLGVSRPRAQQLVDEGKRVRANGRGGEDDG